MWIIDKDYDAEQSNAKDRKRWGAVGVKGPSGCGDDDSKCIHLFRMLCAGDIIYSGRSDDSSSFDPLDNFGQPNYGCDTLEYLEDGKWKSLTK